MNGSRLRYKKKVWIAPDSKRLGWNWAEKALAGTVIMAALASVGLALYLFWPREAEAVRDFEFAQVQLIVPPELKGAVPMFTKRLGKELAKENCLIQVVDILHVKSPALKKSMLVKRVPEPPVFKQAARLMGIVPSRMVEKRLVDNVKGVLFSIYLGEDALEFSAN
ncbi:MAG: hypothetical protein L0196_03800 [candidate division Zixibacteria bacterium]|nr:hypothetical protein [candidate division Zixibacteria bacterium]